MKDEFYIGYLDPCPPGIASLLRRWVIGLWFLSVSLAGLVAALQKPAEPGDFEYGVRRSFEGVLWERPLPMLRVVDEHGNVHAHLLVGAGKFGPPPSLLGQHGRRVRIEGTLIRKGNVAMIEVASLDPMDVVPDAASREMEPENQILGLVELSGELVDTKCHLGVMRPGEGKVHRGCAARCLSGGVPPGLWVSTPDGGAAVVLLVAAEGSGWTVNPDWAARIVRMRGVLSLRDGLPVLAVRHQELVEFPPPSDPGRKGEARREGRVLTD